MPSTTFYTQLYRGGTLTHSVRIFKNVKKNPEYTTRIKIKSANRGEERV